tara:strand:+ start:125 stop:694 length:570 start_codon:yes stop_codon:yes gene_type:complete
MNTNKWFEKFQKENQTTTWRYGVFQSLVEKHLKPQRDSLILVEVGVARGGHIRHLLDTFSLYIKKIYGIDPYKSGYDDTDCRSNLSNEEQEYLYTWVYNYCQDSKFDLIRSSSEYVTPHFKDNSIDAIYIDGDHTFDGVCKDIESWLPKVKPGGMLVGDDFNWASVKKTVENSLSNTSSIGSTWYHFKK